MRDYLEYQNWLPEQGMCRKNEQMRGWVSNESAMNLEGVMLPGELSLHLVDWMQMAPSEMTGPKQLLINQIWSPLAEVSGSQSW